MFIYFTVARKEYMIMNCMYTFALLHVPFQVMHACCKFKIMHTCTALYLVRMYHTHMMSISYYGTGLFMIIVHIFLKI